MRARPVKQHRPPNKTSATSAPGKASARRNDLPTLPLAAIKAIRAKAAKTPYDTELTKELREAMARLDSAAKMKGKH